MELIEDLPTWNKNMLPPAGVHSPRIVDLMEEWMRFTLLLSPHFKEFGNRFSERCEDISKQAGQIAEKGALK